MNRSQSLRAAVGTALALPTLAIITACASSPPVDHDRNPPSGTSSTTVVPTPTTMATTPAENRNAGCARADIAESSEQRAREAKEQHGSDLLDHSGVHGVGVSRCGTNWVLTVTAEGDVPQEEQITEIDGVSVIWIRGGPFTAQVGGPEGAPPMGS